MGDKAYCLSRDGDDMFRSWMVSMPIEDCESFRCTMKKSVSSYTALSGELDEDEAEFEPSFPTESDHDRCIASRL